MFSQNKVVLSTTLAVLGAIELVTFLAIAAWMYLDNEGGWGQDIIMSIPTGMLVAYLAGGITLVPSSVMFMLAVNRVDPERILLAKKMQFVLFIAICVAVLPALLFAEWHSQFFVACLAGFLFYPIAALLVKGLRIAAGPTPSSSGQASELDPATSSLAGQYCAKCGSIKYSTGECPKCD